MKRIVSAVAVFSLLVGCTSVTDNTDSDTRVSYSAAGKRKSPAGTAVFQADRTANTAFFQKSDRQMAYSATLTLQVKQRDVALDKIKTLAESLGGYVVSRNPDKMNVKIPVAQADGFLKKLGSIGTTGNFKYTAEDLTDTITDINVRLDNLKKLRNRLTALLEKSRQVEDILKIEKELNRVTTEIERLTASLQNNRNRVDFVDFSVSVVEEHGVMPGGMPQAVERFSFLRKLASTVSGSEDKPLFDLPLPDGMVTVKGGAGDVFTATTSDDCLLRMWETDVPEDSTPEFWETMLCRALKFYNGFETVKSYPAVWNGKPAVRIEAQIMTGSGMRSYLMVVRLKKGCFADTLQIVEFSGPAAAFKLHEKNILALIPQ